MQKIIYSCIDFVKEPEELKIKLRKDYTRENLAKDIKNSDSFVIEVNRIIQGTGRLEPSREIRMIYINPKSHRKDLGTSIINYLEDLAKNKGHKRVFIHALPSAKGFYKKLKYKKMKNDLKNTIKMGKNIK
jgi:N-acetylglutamate synthase-like GNAT family acetyltransferase